MRDAGVGGVSLFITSGMNTLSSSIVCRGDRSQGKAPPALDKHRHQLYQQHGKTRAFQSPIKGNGLSKPGKICT